AIDLEGRSTAAGEAGSDLSPHPEHFLSHDDYRERANAPGNDRSLLYGLAADALHRHAPDNCFVLVDHSVLHARASGTLPADLETRDLLHSDANGCGRCADDQQYPSS